MATVTIVGAGSVEFTQEVVSDLLQQPSTRHINIHLMDINADHLRDAERLVHRMMEAAGSRGSLHASTELRSMLHGADYVINTVLVGGYEAIQRDFHIAAQYGVRHTVGDTLGVSGIMRAVRTVPQVIDLARAMEDVAPHALLLNYTNPMSMLVMAIARSSSIQHYGLCHSTAHTASQVAEYLEVPFEDLHWLSAGINHMAWLLQLSVNGEDQYPRLLERSYDQQWFKKDPVRFDLLQRLGYFVTESSKHNAEYYAYFAHWPKEIERLGIPINEYLTRQRRNLSAYLQEQQTRPLAEVLMSEPSGEYAPLLIQARETGETWWFQGNVMNDGLIENLPEDACVEVPVLVNRHGILPTKVGRLPHVLAGLNHQAVAVQQLTVDAILEGSRDLLYQAVMMDAQAGAAMTLDQMRNMVDDLLAAQRDLVPSFAVRRLWPSVPMRV
ncbi:MAG: alpha-glucosidase/alpha-galactosidase [Sulfobacillus acidophilus]|uniref:Alpha-glucosidase/alpha-galactosidase n=1 Tax=Sulfobacillus acidophilus TaxID=53633 RepID=A0A2T2WD82_9FIRM|nr:MAG: alpha-glucosidase/alpha-galactosidase [Sulfobacillus acidophilus]